MVEFEMINGVKARLLYKINTSLTTWVATQNSPDRLHGAFNKAVLKDGVVRILGTTWNKPTKPPGEAVLHEAVIGRNGFLIEADEQQRQLLRQMNQRG